MERIELAIKGLEIITPAKHEDERGYFMESFNSERYDQIFFQDNLVYSHKNVVRGLHFQTSPHEQGKLITCLSGKILDVAVDIREGSPTFGKHEAVILSGRNRKQFWIPGGFAHGYSVLSKEATVLYKCDKLWYPESEGGIKWDDSTLNIDWRVSNPIVSEKDARLPSLYAHMGGRGAGTPS